MIVVLICIELSDVLFAVDSIPAVVGITQDPFIVVPRPASNIALRSRSGSVAEIAAGQSRPEAATAPNANSGDKQRPGNQQLHFLSTNTATHIHAPI